MREAAVMGEAEDRSFEIADYIEIGRFRCERERGCGQRRLAVQPGTAHAGAGQEVGDGFQSLGSDYLVQNLQRIHYRHMKAETRLDM